jgi:hypothetical protein
MTLREFAECFNLNDAYCNYELRVCGNPIVHDEIVTAEIKEFLYPTGFQFSIASNLRYEVFNSDRFLFDKSQLLDFEIDKAQLYSISYDKTIVEATYHTNMFLTKQPKATICFSVPLKEFRNVRDVNIYLWCQAHGYNYELQKELY